MKKQKTRVTQTDFDSALLGQIKTDSLQNIPRNILSCCALFAEMVGRRLFGQRNWAVESVGLKKELDALIEAARMEREQWQKQVEEAQAKARASRIILPPHYREN